MNADSTSIASPTLADKQRASQLHYLCHFLEVFASADPVMRTAASHYGERLHDEGCDSDEVIRMAATALLVAIEDKINDSTAVFDWSSKLSTGLSSISADSHDEGEGRRDQAA